MYFRLYTLVNFCDEFPCAIQATPNFYYSLHCHGTIWVIMTFFVGINLSSMTVKERPDTFCILELLDGNQFVSIIYNSEIKFNVTNLLYHTCIMQSNHI